MLKTCKYFAESIIISWAIENIPILGGGPDPTDTPPGAFWELAEPPKLSKIDPKSSKIRLSTQSKTYQL